MVNGTGFKKQMGRGSTDRQKMFPHRQTTTEVFNSVFSVRVCVLCMCVCVCVSLCMCVHVYVCVVCMCVVCLCMCVFVCV